MSNAFGADQVTALICGSDTRIGGALVRRLVAAGVAVVTLDEPQAANHREAAINLRGDLAEEQTWIAAVKVLREHGIVPSMFVHAARGGELNEPEDWDPVLTSNLRSAYLGCTHLLPLMQERGGAIVVVASVLAGWDTRADSAARSASDAGLLALTRSFALIGGPAGIRVNAVCHGLVTTPESVAADATLQAAMKRVPLARPTSPDDVVDAILFLLSPDAAYITGSSLIVDGGQSLQSWSNAPEADGYPRLRDEAEPGSD